METLCRLRYFDRRWSQMMEMMDRVLQVTRTAATMHYGLSPIEKGKLRILQNKYLGPHF